MFSDSVQVSPISERTTGHNVQLHLAHIGWVISIHLDTTSSKSSTQGCSVLASIRKSKPTLSFSHLACYNARFESFIRISIHSNLLSHQGQLKPACTTNLRYAVLPERSVHLGTSDTLTPIPYICIDTPSNLVEHTSARGLVALLYFCIES